MTKKTKNRKLVDEIYSEIKKDINIYYPKDIRKMILITIRKVKKELKEVRNR